MGTGREELGDVAVPILRGLREAEQAKNTLVEANLRLVVSIVDAALHMDLKEQIESLLNKTLTPRKEKILKLRFGVGCASEHTLEEIGQSLAVSRERIRQIESKALHRLQHPSRRDVSEGPHERIAVWTTTRAPLGDQ